MFSLYLHIPFCLQKCRYCDFLSAPATPQVREAYVQALLRELEREAPLYRNRVVETVYVGGGTPTVLTEGQLARLFETLRRCYRFADLPEISMEMNPASALGGKLRLLRALGVNRLSIGLQSDDDRQLARLGRLHTYRQFLESYELARGAGFSNINIDLMAALPGQRLQDHEKTLRRVAALAPEHLSVYSLTLEEGTPLWAQRETLALPDEEEEREMYARTGALLAEAGYRRYEISNYARPGFACRHNLAYWKRTDYVGFGLGAASLLDEVRFRNTASLARYLAGGGRKEDVQPLSRKDAMEEFLFLGLRCMEGVSETEFSRRFGRTLGEVYGEEPERLCGQGLLRRDGDRLRLTERGIDVSNYVFARFLLP